MQALEKALSKANLDICFAYVSLNGLRALGYIESFTYSELLVHLRCQLLGVVGSVELFGESSQEINRTTSRLLEAEGFIHSGSFMPRASGLCLQSIQAQRETRRYAIESAEVLKDAVSRASEVLARRANAPKGHLLNAEFQETLVEDDLVLRSASNASDLLARPIWALDGSVSVLKSHPDALIETLSEKPPFKFWREWYQGFLDGKPLDWELQRRVALIPDADWEQGPEHIAEKIKEIRREFDAEQRGNASKAEEIPVPPATAQAMAKRLRANRDAIAIWATEVGQQIEATREEVRGDNQLDPDQREKILALLDDLGGRLTDLLGLLPLDAALPSTEVGEHGVRWLHGFKTALQKSAKEYAAPDNLAGAIIPTGIILGCTGIGSLMGMPLAGGVVGGLITGQIKPGKAANDLLNSPKTSVD